MNRKMLKLFGEAFLRTMVILLGLAIVVFAVYFIVKVATGGNKKKDPTTTENSASTDNSEQKSSDTEEVTTDTEEPTTQEAISSVGKTIEVLNSTDTAGVAKLWQTKLVAEGFTVSTVGNYEAATLTNTKIIVTEEGMGQDLTSYFKNATIEVGTPTSSGVDIQIIVGTDDAQ